MTTQRSSGALVTVRGAQTAPVESTDALAAAALWHAPISKRDAITLSMQATALLRAGLAVRAFVMSGWENVRQVIALANGRKLVFDNGVYSAL